MNTRFLSRLTIFALVVLVLASVLTAAAAANNVQATLRTNQNIGAPTANQLKPSECASLNLTAIVTGSGSFQGSPASELILGSSGPNTIQGKGGTDCILGGGGDDVINGNAGGDVCIGGPGADTYKKCETEIRDAQDP
jgi:Ca2+-binding RTX toxin-like protein